MEMTTDGRPMAVRTVLLTGATSGIGRAASMALAGMGARMVLVGRNKSRLASVVGEISAAGGTADALPADLSSMGEVRALASEFLEKYDRLDVLVNNAGLVIGQRELTADGYEHTFALDHLAPFLLTNLLMGRLKASVPSRVVTVSSTAHRLGRMHFDDIMLERGYGPLKAYAQAKLANVMFTYELSRRLGGDGGQCQLPPPGTGQDQLRQGHRHPVRCRHGRPPPVHDRPGGGSPDHRVPGLVPGGGRRHRTLLRASEGGPVLPEFLR